MNVGHDAQTSADAERLLELVRQLAGEIRPNRAGAVGLDSTLEGDLQFDSLTRVELMLRVGSAFATTLPEEALSRADTPRDLLAYIHRGSATGAGSAPATLPEASAVAAPGGAATLLEVLDWHAARQPTRTHVIFADDAAGGPLTYAALQELAAAAAAGLSGHGVLPGQTVALMLPTGREFLASFFGVLRAGAIPVPIYPPARPTQIEEHLRRHARILANAGAGHLITVAEARPVAVLLRGELPDLAAILTPDQLRTAAPPPNIAVRGGDTAFLQYTSGSTADPKGVVLSHANLLANIRAMGQAARVSSEDICVSWLPLYHDMGLIGAWLGSLYFGFPLVLMSPVSFLARPVRWLEAISRHRGSISGAPNFAYELCAQKIADDELSGLDLSSWRFAFNGAEPVRVATLAAFIERFAAVGFRREALCPVYGLAESSVALTFPPLGRGPRIDRVRRAAIGERGSAVPAGPGATDVLEIPSCGRPLPGHEVRIVDAAGVEMAERGIGCLEFRGPSATAGYHRNAEASAGLLRDGWLNSGDNAYIADGEVHIVGRVKDLIIRGGRNIYPYDLEEAIGNLSGVRRGCVAAFSRGAAGQQEKLVVIAETRERDESARDALRRRIMAAAFDATGAAIDEVLLVPPHAVLKTSSGKIRRAACRDAYERGEIGTGAMRMRFWALRLAGAALAARAKIGARRAASWGYGAWFWGTLYLLAAPTMAIVMLLRRPALGRRIAAMAARLHCALVRLPVSARGLDRLPKAPHVLLVNHASYLDVLVLTALLPAQPGYTFTAKSELRRGRWLRSFLEGLGTLFVDRSETRQSADDVEAMAAQLRAGHNLVVFPEGTFTRQAGLQPFHLGGFAAAARAAALLVTAGLRGTRSALRDETWLPRRLPITLEIGPAIMPAGTDWAATLQLKAAARRALLPLCGEPDLDAL